MVMIEISEEAEALALRLVDVVKQELNPVRQQMAIEVLMAAHAVRMGDHRTQTVDSMAKHAKQIMEALAMERRS